MAPQLFVPTEKAVHVNPPPAIAAGLGAKTPARNAVFAPVLKTGRFQVGLVFVQPLQRGHLRSQIDDGFGLDAGDRGGADVMNGHQTRVVAQGGGETGGFLFGFVGPLGIVIEQFHFGAHEKAICRAAAKYPG